MKFIYMKKRKINIYFIHDTILIKIHASSPPVPPDSPCDTSPCVTRHRVTRHRVFLDLFFSLTISFFPLPHMYISI